MRTAVVRSVVDTEDPKEKHGVDLRASDGMLTHLINVTVHHRNGPTQVWNAISAEIQNQIISKIQFGAILWIQLKDLNYVT